MGPNITRLESPFQSALRESVSRRQSRESATSPTLMTLYPSLTSGLGSFGSSSRASSLGSIAEPIGDVPRNRRQDLSSFTEEQKIERRKQQQKRICPKNKTTKNGLRLIIYLGFIYIKNNGF